MLHTQLHLNLADYCIIATVVISAIMGLLRGLLREVIAVASWVLAVLLAWHFSYVLEPHLGGLMANSEARPWAARTLIFLGVLLVGSAIGAILGHFVRLSILSSVDRFLGFLFGLVRGVVVVGVAVIICQVLRLEDEAWWRHSVLMPWGEDTAAVLRGLGGSKAKYRHSELVREQG